MHLCGIVFLCKSGNVEDGDFPLKQGKSPGGGNNFKDNPRNPAKHRSML